MFQLCVYMYALGGARMDVNVRVCVCVFVCVCVCVCVGALVCLYVHVIWDDSSDHSALHPKVSV